MTCEEIDEIVLLHSVIGRRAATSAYNTLWYQCIIYTPDYGILP